MDELLKNHQEFDQAELRADADRLESLLAEDFQSIGEQGFVLNKRQWITRHDDFAYVAVENFDVDVRRYERCAIIRDIQRCRATWQGQTMTLNVRRSLVWVEQPDGWRLAAIQFSSLAGD